MDKQTAKLIKLLNSRKPSYVGTGLDITIIYPDETAFGVVTDKGTINIYDDLALTVYENLDDADEDMPLLFESIEKLFEQYKFNYQHTGSFDPSRSSDIRISIPKKTYSYNSKEVDWLLLNDGDRWEAYQFKDDNSVNEFVEAHF